MPRMLIKVALLLVTIPMWGQTAERYVVLDGVSSLARVFNVSDNSQIAAIRTAPIPNSVVISPNGRLVFVAGLDAQYVSVLDLTILTEIKRIRNIGPQQMAISADGGTVVPAPTNGKLLSIIDASTLNVSKTVDLRGKVGDDPTVDDLGFNNPVIANNKVYLNTSSDVTAIDLGTLAITDLSGPDDAFFFLGAENLAVTPDGKTLAAIRAAGLVLFDTATNKPLLTVPFGFAFSVAAGPNPTKHSKMVAYVANAGNSGPVLSVVDLSPNSPSFGTIIAQIDLPAEVLQSQRSMLTMNPSGTRVYLNVSRPTLSSDNDIYIIDTKALLDNPAAAIVHQESVPLQARAVAVGITQTQSPATAPVVTSVDQAEVTNDHAVTLNVFGSGFAPGAQVRVGSLDPAAASFFSPGHLSVVLPQNAPAQIASVIATNPNSAQAVNFQQQSGVLHDALTIAERKDFNPQNQVAVATLGDEGFSIIKANNVDGVPQEFPVGPRPLGLAITPDGARTYIVNLFSPASVDVFNFSTQSLEAHIILNGDPSSIPGQSKGIVLAPRLATGKLAAYVHATKTNNLDLYAIDIDPASPTFNTVIDDIPTNLPNSFSPGSLIMTPDGRFAFINQMDFINGANLVVIDIATRAVTTIPAANINMNTFQPTMGMSADGKFLVLVSVNDNFLIFDITNPTNPTLVTTLFRPPNIIFEAPRILGTRLFAFDIDNNVITIFNFLPASNDFSELAHFQVPAPHALLSAVADITPDGKLIYFPLAEEDSVAVLSVDKIIQNDPAPLITKIGTPLDPRYVAVRPLTSDNH